MLYLVYRQILCYFETQGTKGLCRRQYLTVFYKKVWGIWRVANPL